MRQPLTGGRLGVLRPYIRVRCFAGAASELGISENAVRQLDRHPSSG